MSFRRHAPAATRPRLLSAPLLLLLAAGAPLAAQSPEPVVASAPAPRLALSTNPFLMIFGLYTGEVELGVGRNTTLALSANRWGAGATLDGEDGADIEGRVAYFTSDLHLRYYPGGTLLDGVSLGMSGGYARLSGELSSSGESTGERVGGTALGVELAYNWLLGERRNVVLSTGFGAKRIFVAGVNTASVAYPTAKFTLGVAF